MLDAIEIVHNEGYIHRDIKPSNFVVGEGKLRNNLYLVDFGLGKLYVNNNGTIIEERKNSNFRGTIAYASLNAHNRLVIFFIFRIYLVVMIFGVGILSF